MSDCEPRKESLQISMDEKKFLGDEVILNHSILDPSNLSVSANYSTFPDIDNDGSIDVHSTHEEYEGLTLNGKVDSKENKSGDENKKAKHLPRLASLDDIWLFITLRYKLVCYARNGVLPDNENMFARKRFK